METLSSTTEIVELGSATALTLGASGPNIENIQGGQGWPHG